MTISSEITCSALPATLAGEPMRATIDKRFVHKSYDHNVLVSRIERASATEMASDAESGEPLDRVEHFAATLHVDRDHSFFFEHPRQHVPGLYLIEAGRQMQVAIAHMFYGIPFGLEFVMTRLVVDFRNPANVEDPLIAESRMSKHVYRKGQLVSMQADGVIRQNGLDVASMVGTMMMMDPRLLLRLERRTARA